MARASYGCDRLHEGVIIFVGWLTRFQRSGGGHRGALTYAGACSRCWSNSKTWLLAVALQLAGEGRLNLADTVTHWLPGLLPYGNEINLPELLTDTSGLIDDNDVTRSASAGKTMLTRVKDPELRARLKATAARP